MMLDWNEYQKQIGAQLTQFMKLTPDSVRGYQTLSAANSSRNHPLRRLHHRPHR
jgi:hypothetical protein